jgi:hypothetical protein
MSKSTNNQMEKQFIYEQRAVKPATIWLLFLLVGWSYGSMGQIGKQIFYYLTLGGLGLWALYRLFTLNGKIRNYNKQIALECGFTTDEILRMGLMK